MMSVVNVLCAALYFLYDLVHPLLVAFTDILDRPQRQYNGLSLSYALLLPNIVVRKSVDIYSSYE